MNEKTISQLDENQYFIGPTVAEESPLEPGIYLVPAGAVDFSPPEVPSGKRAKFTGQGFLIEDIPVPPTPVPPVPTKDETIKEIEFAVQTKLDEGAKLWGYQNLVTGASYAASTNSQYAADATALIQWRDDVWAWAIPKFADVTPGETPEEFMVDMPKQPAQPKP